jgi:probable HAF family extracellular repeat protein
MAWLAIALLLASVSAAAQDGISTFDCPGSRVLTNTTVSGVNNLGQIVGRCGYGAFLYSSGTFTYLNGAEANGINNLGQIVGVDQSGSQGFLYDHDTYTTILYPGSSLTWPFSINDNGVIVGIYQASGQQHGFIYSNGVYISFDYPGSASTLLAGINNAGELVGGFCYSPCHVGHGFLVDGSNYTQIDYPGAVGSSVYSINNVGILVGGYNNEIAFIYENGNFESFDYRNSADTAFLGINDRGEFVGFWTDAQNNFHGLRGYLQHP